MTDDSMESADGAEGALADEPSHDVPAAKATRPVNETLDQTDQGASSSVQAFTDRALQFLSTASNRTLGACIVGLSAGTYILLGRVGLVLIGVVGGIALHASWEDSSHGGTDDSHKAQEAKRRKEVGLDVVSRILDWRAQKSRSDQAVPAADEDVSIRPYSGKTLNYADFKPETATALSNLTDAVIRDYVEWWYSPILPTELSFPTSCRQTLTAFVISMSTHLSRTRPADAFLDFLTNASSIVIVFLSELSSALKASPTTFVDEAIQTYLIDRPRSSLANIIDTEQQQKKLMLVAEDILESFLDSKTYNCESARTFLRQVLAELILAKTIESCSKPEWINGWIVYLIEEGEHEMTDGTDAGVKGPPESSSSNVHHEPNDKEDDVYGVTEELAERSISSGRRRLSRAEKAMEDAMQEAKRLTDMIVEDETRRLREQQTSSASSDGLPESTTQGIQTPTSSQSDLHVDSEPDSSRALSEISTRSEGLVNHAAKARPTSTFTSFDQFVPSQAPTALLSTPEKLRRDQATALTLLNAKIVIFDDSTAGENGAIRAKPAADYLIQIEPASTQQPGWMIARKYADFETLHEIMRRISVISGIGFTEAHGILPSWKGHTKASLRGELERYLNDAVGYRLLAESEGMKRFLEKDQGIKSPGTAKGGFAGIGWPAPSAFENMGKGMMDILTKAPKEVAGGGKALFGGVTGVIGGGGTSGLRKPPAGGAGPRGGANQSAQNPSHIDDHSLPILPSGGPTVESGRSSPVVDTQPARVPPMERRISRDSSVDLNLHSARPSMSSRSSTYSWNRNHSRSGSNNRTAESSPSRIPGEAFNDFNLPPLPSDIPDDYGLSNVVSPLKFRRSEDVLSSTRTSIDSVSALRVSKDANATAHPEHSASTSPPKQPPRPSKPKPPITEQETQVAVELLFAVINELYTLSSAWTIRRTILAGAKTFLLRPGNPQLENIRLLLQDTIIEANTSDAGIAAHLRKLRENALPTGEELRAWPPPMSEPEKAALRKKARKLLVERGMPQALTSVMGAAASGEALGKVFDCLQVQEVAQGLVFGLMLQAVRAVVQ